jgi:hypothetical protein
MSFVFLLFFCLSFVLWWVLFLCFCQVYKIFYYQEPSHYLQIKHNKKFLLQKKKTSSQFQFFFLFLSLSWRNNKGRRINIFFKKFKNAL